MSVKPIFIHISKNAGSSIVHSAGAQIDNASHITAYRWISIHGEHPNLFAVIRNPFDRVVSEYFFRRKRYENHEKNPHLANLHLGFNDWLIDTFERGSFCTKEFFNGSGVPYNSANMVNGRLIWFITQCEWLNEPTQNQPLVKHLLRFENLDLDWRNFSSKYPNLPRTLQVVNRSRDNNDYRKHYTNTSKRIIERLFEDDLNKYNYDF